VIIAQMRSKSIANLAPHQIGGLEVGRLETAERSLSTTTIAPAPPARPVVPAPAFRRVSAPIVRAPARVALSPVLG
jgi:hypothetical protein